MAPIKYVPNFIKYPNELFKVLSDDLKWVRRGSTPRSEYYTNQVPVPYTYGKGNGQREYLPQTIHPLIDSIRNDLESFTGAKFEVCFLNRYLNQQDHLGWHADDSPEMDDSRPIVIISLGVEREIWFARRVT